MSLLCKRIHQKLLSLIFVGFLLANVFWFMMAIEPVSGAPALTLKWTKSLGGYAKTYLSPLAANLVGDDRLEIVVVGGSADYGKDGTVTVLDGTTGNVIWQVAPYSRWGGIGMHTPFEIADLNKDGIPEIIIAAVGGVLVLHGNDGSLYWRNTAAPAEENYIAVCDIDGDGYPEIFANRGYGPYNGYDWITSLSYDGNILHQAWCWHPCWGGQTVGDTNFDGIFELYQGDRSNSYSGVREGVPDPYKAGGMGLRALDAHTLTPLWNDPTILCSSHAPMLADVDKDGILDVIAASQLQSGIAVLNSADGSVVTTGGKYRKGATGVPAHSQPTVYDIDGDGNLEYISARSSYVYIWDLYDWKLDAILPVTCVEPPKVGDVTGDGKMDIIAVTGSSQYMYIYSYNKITQSYEQVESVAGLLNANAFTLVQDVDGDGLNELVLTSTTGNVYCFDTPAPALIPRVRSESLFYSERRCGAAEYVPPPTPSRPVLRDEQPRDGSLNQLLNPTLSILATDFQGDLMDITLSTNASGTWEDIGSYTKRPNGVYSVATTNMGKLGTTYYWRVTATDGSSGETSKTYRFTTYSNPPTHDQPILTNEANGDLIAYNQTTIDPDSDEVTNIYNWYVNDTSLTNLLLPFNTRTTNNPLVADELFSDGFEYSFSNWDGNGVTNWDRSTSQAHSGIYSAHATSGRSYLASDNLDTSSAEGITVSFWYREHGISGTDNVYLQFWNGSTYNNIFNLGNSVPEDEWHWYTVQTYDPRYLIANFRIRFDARGIKTGGNHLWIDDVTITAPSRTKDYSGYNNHGTIHGATWTSEGVVGGAYIFDGSNDFIRISDDPSLGGDGTWSEISVEFWVKLLAPLSGARIIAKKVASASTGSYMVGFQTTGSPSNTLFWGINNTAGWQDIWDDTNTVLDVGNWHHVVCTYKSGLGLTIYIDGTQRINRPLTGNIAPSPGVSIYNAPLFIGYDGGGDRRRWLDGALDEVRIYPRALTPQQILQRYLESKDGLSNSSTINSAETKLGEQWKCEVTPNDSYRDGTSKLSNTLTVTDQYTLTVNIAGSGSVTKNPDQATYKKGTVVTLTATPSLGWSFSGWSGDLSGNVNPTAIIMNDNKAVTATFTQNQYTLTINTDGSGSVSRSPDQTTYTYGAIVTLTATPDADWSFSYWSGDLAGSKNPATITITGNMAVTAHFTQKQYTVTLGVEGSGSVTKVPDQATYAYGTVVTLTAVPNVGWSFGGWSGDLSGNVNPTTITMDGDKSVTATFVQLQYTLTVNIVGSGSVIKNPDKTTYTYGETVTLTASASVGWSFSGWGGDLTGSQSPVDIVMDGNKSVTATFTQNVYTLNLESEENTAATFNLGSVTFDGVSYNLPDSASKAVGSYSAKYFAAVGYIFDHWETTGGISVSAASDNPTTIIVSGDGTLKAIYRTYIFADGFESGNFASWNGTSVTSGETATVVTTRPHHGSYSARFTSNGGGGVENAYCYKALDMNEVYVRGYFYIEGGLPLVDNGDRFYLLRLSGTSQSLVYVGIRRDGGVDKWTVYARNGANWMSWVYANNPLPQKGHWTCVELHWKMDSSAGLVQLYVDGTKIIEISGINTAYYGNAKRVDFGLIQATGVQNSLTIYGDCAVISQSYIGPEPAPITYTLSISVVGSGSTDPAVGDHQYAQGDTATVTAIPGSGWSFDHWVLDGSPAGSANPIEVLMVIDHTLSAVFIETPYVFADGFESGNFASWSGSSVTSGETVNVVNTLSHHGSYSARFTSNGDGTVASTVENAYCYKTVDMNEVYVRGYFYIEGGLPLVDEGDRFYLLRLGGSSQNLVYIGVRRNSGVDKWTVYARNGANWMSWTYADSPQMSRWYCVELHWKMDSSAGLVQLYVDGTKIIEISGINTAYYGNAKRVDFGLIQATGVQNSLTIYGDCAVISQSYIGPEP